MNAQDKELKSVYTTQDEIITISLHEYGYEWHVTYTVTITDGTQSEMIDWRLLYNGFEYADALVMYKAACSSQSFLPDNKTSESGQAAILFLIVIVAVIVCLYVAYTGISEASTGTNNMFGYMLSRLGEVLR